MRDQLYNKAAAAGKAEAERTGSIAAGAALAEKIMREGGMQEEYLSGQSADFMNNGLGVMKAKLGEDTTANTNAFIGSIDLSKLNINSMPGIRKAAEEQFGKKVDLQQIQDFVNQHLKLKSDEETRSLQREAMRITANAKDTPFKIDTDLKSGITTYTFKDGSGTYTHRTPEAIRALAQDRVNRKDEVRDSRLFGLMPNYSETQKEEMIQQEIKLIQDQQDKDILRFRGKLYGLMGGGGFYGGPPADADTVTEGLPKPKLMSSHSSVQLPSASNSNEDSSQRECIRRLFP